MHRLTKKASGALFLLAFGLSTACGGPKATESPVDQDKGDSGTEDELNVDGGVEKRDVCVGFDISNLEDLLAKSDCEVADTKPDAVPNPDMKGKLEVALSASPTKTTPGGQVDLVVTFANKTAESLPLYFMIDPLARFETETYDTKKKKRADMPPGNPPPPPAGHSSPPPAEQKVARVVLAPNGSARVRVPWEAVKMKWAPDKVRGTAVEKGYPRVPAGPLPKGKYTVKVMTPLIGVFEGSDREISAPTLEIEVGQ